MKPGPSDFKLQYKWIAGALPPPYHYEYEILVGAIGDFRLTFRPDYPSHGPAVWTEWFSVKDEALDEGNRGPGEVGLYEEQGENLIFRGDIQATQTLRRFIFT